ncbi:MAG: hypothetical protein Q7R90_04205 [bacterium]|nr:hypothetical protein [bacterium]
MSKQRAYITLLVALAVVLIAVYALLSRVSPPASQPSSNSTTSQPRSPSPEVMAYLAQSKGFQYLVSYTDRGFEPTRLTVKQGETVRFTNNSSEDLWVAAGGEKVYPGVVNGCGSSALDSCRPIGRGEFWEFTFDVAGTWMFSNNIDKEKSGTIITVQSK